MKEGKVLGFQVRRAIKAEDERDAALARLETLAKGQHVELYNARLRLAEIEKQEPAYLLTPDGKCYAYGSAQPLSAGHADATLLMLYTAAGASPVATPIVAWAKSTPRKLRITTMDMGGEDGWRPLGYTAAGASPVEPSQAVELSDEEQVALLRFNETCEDGQGYDVKTSMMSRLAEIGVVSRKFGSVYFVTEYGQRVIAAINAKGATP